MKIYTPAFKLSIFIIVILIANISYSQTFNYGLRIGVASFNQNWDFNELPFSGWRNYKTGITTHIFGEINHSDHFSTKLELGYLKKGYYNDLSYEAPDGTYHDEDSYKTDLKTIVLQISERITFLKTKLKPFIKTGLNIQYISNKYLENLHLIVREPNGNLIWFGSQYVNSTTVDWTRFTLNFNVGVGLTYGDLIFIEFELSKSLTPLLDLDYLKVTDKYYGISVGVNINKLIK